MRCYLFLVAAAAGFSLPALSSASQDGLRQQKDKLAKVEVQDEAFPNWAVKTIPNLLSDEECDAIVNFHDIFNREGKANAHKHKADMHEKSVVPVSIELAQRIQTFGFGAGERTPAYAVSTIQLLMIHRTTYLHKDEDDEGMMTVMVFLEDNEDAYFWIEELGQKIPVEKGKLVAFDARFTHNTVIKDMEKGKASSVYLLGPTRVRLDAVANDSINVQRKLQTNTTVPAVFDVVPKGNSSITFDVNGNATHVTNAYFNGMYNASFLVNNGTQAMAVTDCLMTCSSSSNCTATAVQTTPSPTPASTGKSGKKKIRN